MKKEDKRKKMIEIFKKGGLTGSAIRKLIDDCLALDNTDTEPNNIFLDENGDYDPTKVPIGTYGPCQHPEKYRFIDRDNNLRCSDCHKLII